MGMETTESLFQAGRVIYNSDEVLSSGFTVPEGFPIPAPETCRFCGKRLCYEAFVTDGIVRGWYLNEPEQCDCPAAVEYRAIQERIRAQQEAEEKAQREMEQRKQRIERLLGSSGIKARFASRTFETFKPSADNKAALEASKKYAAKFGDYRKRGYGIYFEGTCGTGKTHLAAAIGLALIHKGVPVIFRTAGDLLRELKRTYDGGTELREDQVLSAYNAADLLIIDDLGKERPTEWTVDRLYAIINERYEQMLPVVITTNYNQNDLIKRLTPAGGDNKTAEAIVSRLRECAGIVTMAGKDYREAKK